MNKVLITIGTFPIYWYSVIIIVALFIGINIADRYSKKMQLPGTLITDMLLGLVLSSIIGARLYYVIFKSAEYENNLSEIVMVWKGGLAIYGAIIAGAIYILYYCIKKKISFIKVLDICSLSLLLGQAIGRYISINATVPVYVGNRQVARELKKIEAEDDFASNGG